MVASPNLVKLRELTESLQQKDKALNSFFDLALDCLAICDTEGKFVKLNPIWEKTLGWDLEELKSKPFLEFVHPADQEATADIYNKMVTRGEKVFYFRNRYLCKDGNYKVFCWTAQFDPEYNYVYAVARDYDAMLEKVLD